MIINKQRMAEIKKICESLKFLDNFFDVFGTDTGVDIDMTFQELFEKIDMFIEENCVVKSCDKAMEFLTEHDPSLVDSLQLAEELGYTLDNINSKTLATLLNAENMTDAFDDVSWDLEEFFKSKKS